MEVLPDTSRFAGFRASKPQFSGLTDEEIFARIRDIDERFRALSDEDIVSFVEKRFPAPIQEIAQPLKQSLSISAALGRSLVQAQQIAEGANLLGLQRELDRARKGQAFRFSKTGQLIFEDPDPQSIQEDIGSSASRLAQFGEELDAIPYSDATQKVVQDVFGGHSPGEYLTAAIELGLSSLILSAPSMAGQIMGAVAGPAGSAAGAAAGTFITEYPARFIEALQDEGVDVSDADALKTIFTSKEGAPLISRAQAKAVRQAASVTGVEAASAAGVASAARLVNSFRTAAARAAGTAALGAAEAATEAAGEFAASGDIEEAAIEALAAGPISAPGTVLGVRAAVKDGPSVDAQPEEVATQDDTGIPKGRIESMFDDPRSPEVAAQEEGAFGLRARDRFARAFLDKFTPVWRAVSMAEERAGITKTSDPLRNPKQIISMMYGTGRQVEQVVSDGLIDFGLGTKSGQTDFHRDAVTGEQINGDFLYGPLDQSSLAVFQEEIDTSVRLQVARRTLELSENLGREDVLTGISEGTNKTDVQVANEEIAKFDRMTQADPEKAARINEAGRRYRVMADMFLQYAEDTGLISAEQHQQINNKNRQYIALRRLAEGDEFDSVFGQGGLGALANVTSSGIKKIRGSKKKIRDPFEALIEGGAEIVGRANRNLVLKSFFDVMRDASATTDVSDMARPREVGEGVRQVQTPAGPRTMISDKNIISYQNNGITEDWVVDADIARALKNLESRPPLPLVFTAFAKTLRWTVTHFPVFAARNITRDTFHRLVVTRSGTRPQDFANLKRARVMMNATGAGQFGFYLATRRSYQSMMRMKAEELAKSGTKVVSLDGFQRAWKGYNKILTSSELLNRQVEWNAAYRKAIKEGLNDFQASLKASSEARGLLDFAVAGETMAWVNQVIPFSNAAVQGLRRGAVAAVENPIRFTARIGLYVLLPELVARGLAMANGYDDEYDQLPDYQRDLFWNFKLGPDLWLSIPKPFELGVLGTGLGRAIDRVFLGKENAMDGYWGSVASSMFPFDETTILGPGAPIIGAMANKDFFRGKAIIPPHEQAKDVRLRKGTKRASRLSQMLSKALDKASVRTDPRKLDFLVRSTFSYFGNAALKASNFGSEELSTFDWGDTGFLRRDPVWAAKDVQWVVSTAKRADETRSDEYQELQSILSWYFDAKTPDERSERGKVVREYASSVRSVWEEVDLIKTKSP